MTGATSGIGAATARRLRPAARPSRSSGAAGTPRSELAADIGDERPPVAADVGDPSARPAAETVRAAFGRVDLVVANAGVMLGAPWEEAEPPSGTR